MSLQLSLVKTLNICNESNGDTSGSSDKTTEEVSTCELDTGDCTGVPQSRDPASPKQGCLQEPLPQRLVEHGEIDSITSSDDSSSDYWSHPSFPPTYHGFINLVTMEPANQSSAEGVRVERDLLHPVRSLYETPLPELLKNLDNQCSREDRDKVIRMMQVDLLPLLAEKKQLSEISECLMIEEAGLQRTVCSFLEEILLSFPRSHDVSATKGLLDVAEKSMSVLMKSTDDEDNVLSFTSLHLMAVSAIFICSQKPELEKCSSFILSPKKVKKIAHGGIKQADFKSLNQFYERFKEEIEELSSLPDWTRVASSPVEQKKVKDKCSRASFCKLVLYAFLILNEVALKGWSPGSVDLLCLLKIVHEVAVLRTEKQKMSRKSRTMIQESRSMFDFLIVRGLILLLNTTFSEVRDPGPVPLRWTAPEALFEGRYSPKSAIWAFGCVMQEIATYGCEPYTSYNMTTEQILIKMKREPGNIKLFHWPFIQCELFSLIEKCTMWDPEERPSFAQVKEELSSIQATGSFGELPLEEALSKECRYPTPSNSQIVRRHVPEKGIPKSVQQLIDARETSELYQNTRVLSWHCKPHTAIEPGELFVSDSIDIQIKNDVTRVKEKLREEFVNDELRLIESSKLPVKCWADGEQGLVRLIQHDEHHVHEREYGASEILKNIVAKDDFWSHFNDYNNETSFKPSIFHVLTSLANTMCQLHKQGWLFRDFRASNVLVDSKTGKAFLARIGRMRHLRDTEDSLVEEPFPDSWRRLAPEVLVAKTYIRASDVFMFGTMIWELFNIRKITKIHPKARDEDFEPFTGIPRNKVINFVKEGTPLPRHDLCPVWLYELILHCRHPNPTQRPTAEHVSHILSNRSATGASTQPLLLRSAQSTVQDTEEMEDPEKAIVKVVDCDEEDHCYEELDAVKSLV